MISIKAAGRTGDPSRPLDDLLAEVEQKASMIFNGVGPKVNSPQ
jgi:hypothetical protein